VIIDKIVVQNFGVYKDRQELCLTPPSPDKPIILIGGLNGCGKTTLLDAFQLALYGKFAKCSNRRPSQAYNDFLKQCMNRSVNPAEGTAVEIVFSLFVEGDEHEYHIKRSWHLANKSIIENFEVFLDGKLDEVLRDGWYDFLEEFLPVRLANLFFFDGEKIESLADLEKTSGLLATAIHALLGVDLVEQLSKDLLILERRKIQTQMSVGDSKNINETVHSIQECQNNKVALKQEHADLTNTLEKLWKNRHDLESKYKRKGGDLLAERENIEKEKLNIENLLATANGKAREIATDVAPLIMVKDLLDDVFKQSLQEQKVQEADILGTALEKRVSASTTTSSISAPHMS
jgi:DNA sulfur modification protein DndD